MIQPGARRHYAVPAMLAQAGYLKAFYTDLHAEHAVFRLFDAMVPAKYQPKTLRRLLDRRLPEGLDKNLVHDFSFAALSDAIFPSSGGGSAGTTRIEKALLTRLAASDLGPGDIVYTLFINSDVEVLQALKAREVKIVHDCMIGPDVGLIVHEERNRYPGIEQQTPLDRIKAGRARDRIKYDLCDLIITPSEFTRRAVIDLGADPDRVEVVSFGVNETWSEWEANPRPRRVLTVGAVGLRKGNHYLAEAARQLKDRGLDCEIVVAGSIDDDIRANPLFLGPTYLDQVPRSRIKAEFAKADIFVFPTLCDSFGIVQIEALAFGLPIIATEHCGEVVRDGKDGFVIPVRNSTELAEKIEAIVMDRDLRNRLSANARQRAADYTLTRYQKRLLDVLDRRFGDNGS